MNKHYSDKELESKWLELTDIPFCENDKKELILDVDWWLFSKGTDRDEIWHFFDKNYSAGVAYLIYDFEAEN